MVSHSNHRHIALQTVNYGASIDDMEHITDDNRGCNPQTPDLWLTRVEVAERLKLPLSTINGWATKGVGPSYAIFGRHSRYRLIDVLLWEQEQFSATASSTSADANNEAPSRQTRL